MDQLGEDIKFKSQLEELIQNTPNISDFFAFKDIQILSNIHQCKTIPAKHTIDAENVHNFTNLLLVYVWNILNNNNAAQIRKKPPYELLIKSMVCFKTKQFQLYMFVDDAIFGLVVGTKFKNVTNLIQTLFPISAKMDFSNEIRFFPCSRESFNTTLVKPG